MGLFGFGGKGGSSKGGASTQVTEKSVARDTGQSVKSVRETWHQARSDAQASGELSERQSNKVGQAHEKLVRDAFTGGNKRK